MSKWHKKVMEALADSGFGPGEGPRIFFLSLPIEQNTDRHTKQAIIDWESETHLGPQKLLYF